MFFKGLRDQLKASALVTHLEYALLSLKRNELWSTKSHLSDACKALTALRKADAEEQLTFEGWRHVSELCFELTRILASENQKDLVGDATYILEFSSRRLDESGGFPDQLRRSLGKNKQSIYYYAIRLKASGNPKVLHDWDVLGKAWSEPDGNHGVKHKSACYEGHDMLTLIELNVARQWKMALDSGAPSGEQLVKWISSLRDAAGLRHLPNVAESPESDSLRLQAAVMLTVAYMLSDLNSYNVAPYVRGPLERLSRMQWGGTQAWVFTLTDEIKRPGVIESIDSCLLNHMRVALSNWPRA